jgi:hypothetical protein
MNQRLAQKLLIFILSIGLTFFFTGCGTVQHNLNFQNNYAPPANTKIEVGSVTNQTGQTFNDVNVEQLLSDALAEALRKEDLLWAGGGSRKLVLTSKIAEYEPGNAFKRWLLPGWGSTVLTVQGDLKEGDRLVGSVEARRTVSIGGGYTIGAWRTIFASVANDMVSDLRSQIQKQ